MCACVGAFVGPHCEYVVVNDAVSESELLVLLCTATHATTHGTTHATTHATTHVTTHATTHVTTHVTTHATTRVNTWSNVVMNEDRWCVYL